MMGTGSIKMCSLGRGWTSSCFMHASVKGLRSMRQINGLSRNRHANFAMAESLGCFETLDSDDNSGNQIGNLS